MVEKAKLSIKVPKIDAEGKKTEVDLIDEYSIINLLVECRNLLETISKK